MNFKLRPYQIDGLSAIWDYFNNGNTGNPVVAWPTGCHAKGTPILMYDGSIKKVEDVRVNDFLMGPDSLPRKVLNLARGKETMIKIIPTKGEPFVVNVNHILSLKTTQEKGIYTNRNGKLQKGSIENISIKNYLNKSKWFKHTRKLWKPEKINFSNNSNLPLTPRFMGIFLGDGGYSHNTVSITSMDEIIIQYCLVEIEYNGDGFRRGNNCSKADTIYIKRGIKKGGYKASIGKILSDYGFQGGNKFIPFEYSRASYEDRLELLAGLIDTDGSLICGGYDFISKFKQLAEDVVFVARSVGLAAYLKECKKKSQYGTEGIYYRVSITGNVNIIPVLLPHKRASARKQKKDVCVTGFNYEILPEDDFYGFELDSDHLYLTADFTVHHNTGKSVVPAMFIMEVMKIWPNQRFLIITHVKELIKQNYDLMVELWPSAPAGIYSAGLKQRDVALPIIFGGIQSMIKNPAQFGHRDIIFIDEAHLVGTDDASRYLTFIATMKLINPHLKVIGMSATPFRMGMGYITDGGLFTDICHDITSLHNFNKLIEDGYIKPLIPKRTKTELDVSTVGIQNGEFKANELQAAVDKNEITYAGLREIVEHGYNRQSWLLFASGVDHADHIADMLETFGIQAAAVHSKHSDAHNDGAIDAFKRFEIQAIVNFGKLTTGFNHPAIDLIGMFRPTLSVPLWIQMLGRGTRPYRDQENCLVLDFAKNTPRLGPINDPIIPRKKGEGSGDAPVKICENCGAYNHAAVRFCCDCGQEFEFETKIVKSAGTEELIKTDRPIFETFDVSHAIYSLRQSRKDGRSYVKISYVTGIQSFSENVFPEHKGFARQLFKNWWMQRHKSEPPETVTEVMRVHGELRVPRKIVVHVNKKPNAEVLSCEY